MKFVLERNTLMSGPLERAKEDLAKLREQMSQHDEAIRYLEAEKLRAERSIEEVSTFIRLYDRYSDNDGKGISAERAKSVDSFSIKERIFRIAEEDIKRAGHRVPFENIFRSVINAGISLGGKDDAAKRNNVSGVLSRDERLHGLRHKGWWLRMLGPCPDDADVERTETADLDLDDSPAASAEPRHDQWGNGTSEPVNPWPEGGT
jgi:hypothetical protein